jgi:two-component system LytT family response regulator
MHMKLRVLIADDEWMARERLKNWLSEEPDVQVVGECSTGREALDAIRGELPDLVMLDVRMPDIDGFEVLRALGPGMTPMFVFVTAHEEFALQAFEARALDYLLKPIERPRFRSMLDHARTVALQRRPASLPASRNGDAGGPDGVEVRPVGKFAIRMDGKIIFLDPERVEWIRAADNYLELHVGKSAHLLRRTLSVAERQLPPGRFARISRSLIVNTEFVREIRSRSHGDYMVVMRDATELPGSRNHRDALAKLTGRA